MAHQARSSLVGHYRVLDVALAVDREMAPRRFAQGNQEETQPRADDPDETDELDGLTTSRSYAHLLECMKPSSKVIYLLGSCIVWSCRVCSGFMGAKIQRSPVSVISGRCADMSISILPPAGVDPSGTARAEGLIGMLKRCTRARILGGPFKHAKCVGSIRFGTHCILHEGIGSGSELGLACLVRKSGIQDQELGTFDCDPRTRASWFLGAAQQKGRSVYVLVLHERQRG